VRGFRPSVSSFLPPPSPKNPHRQTTSPTKKLQSSGGRGGGANNNDNSSTNNPYVDVLYIDLISQMWFPDPNKRPNIHFVVQILKVCYSNCLHRTIPETPYIVNYQKLHEEQIKVSVMNQSSSSSALSSSSSSSSSSQYRPTNPIHFAGGGISSPFLQQFSYSPSNNAFSSSVSSSFPGGRLNPGCATGRPAPSKELIETISIMKSEVRWSKLDNEENGCYLVLTPMQPHYMLWATKKWTQWM
jgi:hypothetical protein